MVLSARPRTREALAVVACAWVLATAACDDGAALRATAEGSACERAAKVGQQVPTAEDEAFTQQLDQLQDSLDRIAGDAHTSGNNDLDAAAHNVVAAADRLPAPAESLSSFTTRRAALLDALDDMTRACSVADDA